MKKLEKHLLALAELLGAGRREGQGKIQYPTLLPDS